MESSGADKAIVQPGETVTLKILLNYELRKTVSETKSYNENILKLK